MRQVHTKLTQTHLLPVLQHGVVVLGHGDRGFVGDLRVAHGALVPQGVLQVVHVHLAQQGALEQVR